MSNNVLILDAGCQNFGKGGELNHYLSRLAEGELTKLGWNVEITLIDSQWEIAAEAEKIKKADVIIVQTPGWWMSLSVMKTSSLFSPASSAMTAALICIPMTITAEAEF